MLFLDQDGKNDESRPDFGAASLHSNSMLPNAPTLRRRFDHGHHTPAGTAATIRTSFCPHQCWEQVPRRRLY